MKVNMRDVLLVSIDSLKSDSYLDSNTQDNNIRIAALYVQDTIIQKVTGTCLFNALKEMVCTGVVYNPAVKKQYKELLDDFLYPIFIYGVQAELAIPLTYKESNAGVKTTSDPDLSNPSINEVAYNQKYYQNRMDFYVDKAIKWLCCNHDCFPELCGCECCWYQDVYGSKRATTPLNLRPDAKRTRLSADDKYHFNWWK